MHLPHLDLFRIHPSSSFPIIPMGSLYRAQWGDQSFCYFVIHPLQFVPQFPQFSPTLLPSSTLYKFIIVIKEHFWGIHNMNI